MRTDLTDAGETGDAHGAGSLWRTAFSPAVPSTMDWARNLIGVPPFNRASAFRVHTATQLRGRGRRGARWLDHPGRAVLTTLAIRRGDRWDPGDANPAVVGLRAGVAVAAVVARLGVPAVAIKWPNDVLVGGRKVCGVLVEADPRWFFIGIGLNLARPVGAVAPTDLPPTGIAEELAAAATATTVVGSSRILARLDQQLAAALAGPTWHEDLTARLAWRGAPVTLVHDDTVRATGVLAGVAPSGEVLIDGATGRGRYSAGSLRPGIVSGSATVSE